jgi:sarcosine oxidase subunit gamma
VPDPLTRQSALAARPESDDLIQERTGLWIQRLYAPDRELDFGNKTGLDLPGQANHVSQDKDLHALWVAPREWLLVSEVTANRDGLAARVAASGGALSDLSHARTVLRLAAEPARDILAKGCPLDLRPASFLPGHCAQSVLAGVGILLHHLADGAHMDIYTARSYGRFIYAWLDDAAPPALYQRTLIETH